MAVSEAIGHAESGKREHEEALDSLDGGDLDGHLVGYLWRDLGVVVLEAVDGIDEVDSCGERYVIIVLLPAYFLFCVRGCSITDIVAVVGLEEVVEDCFVVVVKKRGEIVDCFSLFEVF